MLKACDLLAPQDPGVKREKPGGTERRRREDRGAEGAEGGRVWGGVSPSPLGKESGEGAVPPPQKIFRFLSSKRRPLVHSGCYFCS